MRVEEHLSELDDIIGASLFLIFCKMAGEDFCLEGIQVVEELEELGRTQKRKRDKDTLVCLGLELWKKGVISHAITMRVVRFRKPEENHLASF